MNELNELLYNGVNEIIKAIEEFKVERPTNGITNDELLTARKPGRNRLSRIDKNYKHIDYKFDYMDIFKHRDIFDIMNEMSNYMIFRCSGPCVVSAVANYYDMINTLANEITRDESWFESDYAINSYDYYKEYYDTLEKCKADDTKFRKRINMELALGNEEVQSQKGERTFSVDDYALIREYLLDKMLDLKDDILEYFE